MTALSSRTPSSGGQAPLLFQPLAMRDVVARNRIMVSPMCQYSAIDGVATDWHLVHLGRFAIGGAGIVCVEATAIAPEGRITHGDLGIWTDEQALALARVAGFLKEQGSVPAIQIGHAGRRASTLRPWETDRPITGLSGGGIARDEGPEPAWTTVAPSALAFQGLPAPRELTQNDLARMLEQWTDAARRADQAGFEFLEIHGAHGYLLSTFLSPSANRRNDAYGGSREGRMRFPLEVVEAVRRGWPAGKPMSIRISSIDGDPDGWRLEDSVAFAIEAKARGVDFIDCSAGGAVPPSGAYPRQPVNMRLFAETIRRDAGVATITLGRVSEPHDAEAILQDGKADLVAVGRGMLQDPNWAQTARNALKPEAVGDALWPRQVGYALRILYNQITAPPK